MLNKTRNELYKWASYLFEGRKGEKKDEQKACELLAEIIGQVSRLESEKVVEIMDSVDGFVRKYKIDLDRIKQAPPL